MVFDTLLISLYIHPMLGPGNVLMRFMTSKLKRLVMYVWHLQQMGSILKGVGPYSCWPVFVIPLKGVVRSVKSIYARATGKGTDGAEGSGGGRGRSKSRGSRGGGRRRGKAARAPSPSPSPSVHDSGEEEEEHAVGEEEEREVGEELPSVNGSEASEDKEGEASQEPSGVFSRGPAQLPSRSIPVDRQPVIRPVLPRNWDVITPGDHDRPPNGILGILCRQWYPGVVQYRGKQEPALTCFAHKAKRVMMELWDFFRCEPGMEDMVARVVNKVYQKLITDMFYEARIQAVITYHGQVLKTTVTKNDARTMQLTRAQYLLVPPAWLATHYNTRDFLVRRWCDPEWWEQMHKAAQERRLKMPGPAHHQGSQSLSKYVARWSAAHGGQSCGQFKEFALTHKDKASSDVDFNPEDPPRCTATPPSTVASVSTHQRQGRSMGKIGTRAPTTLMESS
ncbi:hypothetical protein EJB05_08671, partial [Eragrostis curvula]